MLTVSDSSGKPILLALSFLMWPPLAKFCTKKDCVRDKSSTNFGRCLSFSIIRAPIRLDVLVEPQDILGIVLFLDTHQPSIVRPVRRPHKLFARFAQLVDVHSMRKRLQLVAQRRHPLHRTRLLSRSTPG